MDKLPPICKGSGRPPARLGSRIGKSPPSAVCPVCQRELPILTFQGLIPAHFDERSTADLEAYVEIDGHLGKGRLPTREDIVSALAAIREVTDLLAQASQQGAVQQLTDDGEKVPAVLCRADGLITCSKRLMSARNVLERGYPSAKTRRKSDGDVVELYPAAEERDESLERLREKAKALGILVLPWEGAEAIKKKIKGARKRREKGPK